MYVETLHRTVLNCAVLFVHARHLRRPFKYLRVSLILQNDNLEYLVVFRLKRLLQPVVR